MKQAKNKTAWMAGTLKKKKKMKEGRRKSAEPKAKKQEAYSQVICQSERGLYLDGVILLFVRLCRESFSC